MAQYRPVLTTDPGPQFESCRADALRLLTKAADEWAKGDPSDPDPEKVLDEILRIFLAKKFLRIPFGAGPT